MEMVLVEGVGEVRSQNKHAKVNVEKNVGYREIYLSSHEQFLIFNIPRINIQCIYFIPCYAIQQE